MKRATPFPLLDRPVHRDNLATRRAIVAMRQAEPVERETVGDAVRAFLVLVMLVAAFYAMALAAAAYAIGEAVK